MQPYRRFMIAFVLLTILLLSLNGLLMADAIPLPGAGIAFDNLDFEIGSQDNADLPASWQGKNLGNDGRSCDDSLKNAPHNGACAFVFRANKDKASQLKQSLYFVGETNKVIEFSLWVKARKLVAPGSSITLKTVYDSGSVGIAKVVIPSFTYDYYQLPVSLPLTQANGKLTISIKMGKGTGKLVIDDLSLQFTVNGSTLTPSSTPTATNTSDGFTLTPSKTPIGQPTPPCGCGGE